MLLLPLNEDSSEKVVEDITWRDIVRVELCDWVFASRNLEDGETRLAEVVSF